MLAMWYPYLLSLGYLAGLLVCGLSLFRSRRFTHIWCSAKLCSNVGLASVLVNAVAALLMPDLADPLTLLMSALVALLGWVIIRYSQRYLEGETNQPKFVCALLATLSSVGLIIVTDHLAVLALAWGSTSISLHFLLTFYPERRAAQVVAHKKFIVSRLADLCLLLALALIYSTTDTLSITQLNNWVQPLAALPSSVHIAISLFALAAILKAAQLPLHGWLIQVMEAPTPVSALLHAGIVNIGGFVLIRLAELVNLASFAQSLLILVGSLSAVLAGLVMMTRISIKVRLAWSTCAQMGFMLMEIGLGLYELALLHLLAHSVYKAHAFLAAGDTLAQARSHDYWPWQRQVPPPLWSLLGLVASALTLAISLLFWQQFIYPISLPLVALLIVTFGLAPLLWPCGPVSWQVNVRGIWRMWLLTQVYLLWHWLFAAIAPAPAASSSVALCWVGGCFLVLYSAQTWLRRSPQSPWVDRLYAWAYNGFYLDEAYTRLTFQLWPPKPVHPPCQPPPEI